MIRRLIGSVIGSVLERRADRKTQQTLQSWREAALMEQGKIYAPFTVEQQAALNRYQAAQMMHPVTCGGDGCIQMLVAFEVWRCPNLECGYTQDWSHAFMADDSTVFYRMKFR